jgi:hypothetical protein
MLRYKLRTLLIVLALGPLAIAWGYQMAEQHRRRQEIKRLVLGLQDYHGDSVLGQPAIDYDRISWSSEP